MENEKYKYKEIKMSSVISTQTLLKQLGDLILIPNDQNDTNGNTK